MRPLERSCEWLADDVADESLWTETFTAAELDELDSALRLALTVSEDVLDISREEFPLPVLASRLARIERELIGGRGFVRLRGIDRHRYTQGEMEMLYWGIGMHLGTPWPQNKHGHMLGDVTDQGKTYDDPTARGNEIGGMALPFHCDGSDLVGLMCLENGISGGLSTIANSVAIHNRLVREHPELAAELYEPQPYDYRGEQIPGHQAWYALPVFTEMDGRLFVRCILPYILASQRHADAPRLTPRAREALSTMDAMANEPRHHVAMELRPGDMQFINNFHVLHGRTAYCDDRTGGAVRHLKRLWLETRVLAQRPTFFENTAGHHWGRNRTVSRIPVPAAHGS
ncbi:MAG TPA: TauD/TfdA family dioxygenase [Candidatus Binatia bacterium]|jgi:alpha-ketoglutarate-dependent taurine dioxygenase